ncbi:hypothetical protein BV898_19671 [Hypsibius exemplaris]|uniref:THAP-type domain-containing protein n=1 Tax=Hypsibius exemplaris TaxID=2072580 RepID=A0A9X6NLW7_HYPEX|nr:hypothetical protein BV898_19671 [Hypsibius exemplaris]
MHEPLSSARSATASVRQLRNLSHNAECFDCGVRLPAFVNCTIGSFVCSVCADILCSLSPPHRLIKISNGVFALNEVAFINSRGNEICLKIWPQNANIRTEFGQGARRQGNKRKSLEHHLATKYSRTTSWNDRSELPVVSSFSETCEGMTSAPSYLPSSVLPSNLLLLETELDNHYPTTESVDGRFGSSTSPAGIHGSTPVEESCSYDFDYGKADFRSALRLELHAPVDQLNPIGHASSPQSVSTLTAESSEPLPCSISQTASSELFGSPAEPTKTKRKHGTKVCSVALCNAQSGEGVTMLRFPKSQRMRRRWEENTRRGTKSGAKWKSSTHSRICTRHFPAAALRQFKGHTELFDRENVLPTLNLPGQQPIRLSRSSRLHTDLVLLNETDLESEIFSFEVICAKSFKAPNNFILQPRQDHLIFTSSEFVDGKLSQRSMVIRSDMSLEFFLGTAIIHGADSLLGKSVSSLTDVSRILVKLLSFRQTDLRRIEAEILDLFDIASMTVQGTDSSVDNEEAGGVGKELSCLMFLREQTKLVLRTVGQEKGRNFRYSDNLINVAFVTYLHSPAAYDAFLNSGCVVLPSRGYLSTMLTEYSSPFNTKAAMKPEMLEEIAKRIGEREPHPDFHDHEYAICIDEMKISGRKVFTADRLYGRPANTPKPEFEGQPAGYILSVQLKSLGSYFQMIICTVPVLHASDDFLRSFVEMIIRSLASINVHPRKIITDNAIQNQHVFRNHLVRDPVALLQDYDCRLDIEGNKEIDWHPDATHGIKNIRNSLIGLPGKYKPAFKLEGAVLRGSGFTEGIFNIDLVRRLWRKEQYTVTSARLAPCLSAIVVQPAEIERQKVWPAVKLFSGEVQSALTTYHAAGDVEFKNAPVVCFVFSMINKFWSIVNGVVKNGDGSVEWLKDTWLPFYRELCRAKPVDPKIQAKIITDDTRDSILVTTASTIRTLDYLFSNVCNYKYVKMANFQQDSLENNFGFIRYSSGNATHPTVNQVETAQKRGNAMSQFAHFPSRRSANCYQGPDKNKKRFRKPIKVSLTGNRLLARKKRSKRSLTGYAACISRLGWDSMLESISDVAHELPSAATDVDPKALDECIAITSSDLWLPNHLQLPERNAIVYLAGACQRAAVKTFAKVILSDMFVCPLILAPADIPASQLHYLKNRDFSDRLIVPSSVFLEATQIAVKVHMDFRASELENHPTDTTTVRLLSELARRKMKNKSWTFSCQEAACKGCGDFAAQNDKILSRVLQFMFRVLISRRVKDQNALVREQSRQSTLSRKVKKMKNY